MDIKKEKVDPSELIKVTDVSQLTITEEIRLIFEKFPGITEFEYEALLPYVMQFYIESYSNGNPLENTSDNEEENKMNYLSERFILIGTKLGVGT